MEKTIFAKKRTTKEGKIFYTYLTTLHKKTTDEDITVQVKFREECGQPKADECPMNIVLNDGDMNFTEKNREYTTEDGEIKTIVERTLWVNKWSQGSPYIDESMNDFD